MTRKKVKLAWIVNDNARKASLKRRRVGLLKKVSELATLCDVSACVLIYIPDDNEPTLWPSLVLVQHMLEKFYDLPDMEQQKKMIDYETYLIEKVGKLQEQIRKLQRKRNEAEMSNIMLKIYYAKGFDKLSISELSSLTFLVDEKIDKINKMYEFNQEISSPFQPGPYPLPPTNQVLPDEVLQAVVKATQLEPCRINRGEGSSSRIKTEIGQSSHHACADNSSEIVGNDMGIGLPPLHGVNFRIPCNGMGLLPPHGSFKGHNDIRLLPSFGNINIGRGSSSSAINDMGMRPHPYYSINNEGFNDSIDRINDMVFELQPHQNLGGDNIAWSDLGLPFGNSEDGNSGGNDISLPYDVTKTRQNHNNSL